MKEQLITLETAKLAKEKGFDWPSWHLWKINGSPTSYLLHATHFDFLEASNFNKKSNGKHMCSAPNQALLQKWLRDVHKIIVLPNRDVHKNYKGYYYHIMTHYVEADKPIIVTEEDWKNFDTYEAALEAGLLKALKLIEDV